MILDTNALSAAAEGDTNLRGVLESAAEVAIPVIVLGEYRYGISFSRNRRQYEQWLVDALPHFQILDVDERTATSYAAIRTQLRKAATPIPSNDAWIAALCLQHSMPILTRDRHFDFVQGISNLTW